MESVLSSNAEEMKQQMKMNETELYVIKRDGSSQPVSFDKVLFRICKLCKDKSLKELLIDGTLIAQKVCAQIYPGVTTKELDELASQLCSSMSTINPEYGELAARIIISNHHKNTNPNFYENILELNNCTHLTKKYKSEYPLIPKHFVEISKKYQNEIQNKLDFTKDYLFDYFGFKTLEKSYLLRLGDRIIERPQQLWMRVAIGLYGDDIENAFRCYDELSSKCYTHATPTLFNSGTKHNQLASCFLLAMQEDSISGIYDTLKDCALISKYAGGIGLHVHNIRSMGSWIKGTNGTSNGLVPMLRVFNDTARYVDQGGGKRNGSFSIYIEPWHADINDFLHLKRNHGDEQSRARDLFYALWIPDLFMKRVRENGYWTLFDPNDVPGLSDNWGDKFESMYHQYELEGFGKKIKAQSLWSTIVDSMVETGTPYILFKDACNRKSNQSNLGTIKSSNLCTEIIEYSSKDETAVCNLASISLPAMVENQSLEMDTVVVYGKPGCIFCSILQKYIKRLNCVNFEYFDCDSEEKISDFKRLFSETTTFPQVFLNNKHIGGYTDFIEETRPKFNFDKLHQIARSLTKNLNKTIDKTFYPTESTRRSNMRHRPIGLGVQGLADVFLKMKYTFDSKEAKELNKKIFACIYHGAMTESIHLSKIRQQNLESLKELYIKSGYESYCNTENWYINPFDYQSEKYYDAESYLKELNLQTDVVPKDKHLMSSKFGGAYSSFEGSHLSEGRFQFDLWGQEGHPDFDWESLRADVQKYGARNSLLVAPMPTASTAQILANNECFEPITSNIYVRRTLAGEFVIVNKYLMQDLIDMGLWNQELKDIIIYNEGSIQAIKTIPKFFRDLYKTVWDLSQKVIIDMAADRGCYICQSQSMNLFLPTPTSKQITSMIFYGWSKGLKTGMYYLRTKPASKAQQFTIDPKKFEGQIAGGETEECLNCSA